MYGWLGMAYKRDWPLAKLFDYHLIRIVMESGVMERLKIKYYWKNTGSCRRDDGEHPSAEMHETVLLILIMVIGWVLALMVLILECSLFHRDSKISNIDASIYKTDNQPDDFRIDTTKW